MVDKFAGVAVMRHAYQADTPRLDGAVGHRPEQDASRRSLPAFGRPVVGRTIQRVVRM